MPDIIHILERIAGELRSRASYLNADRRTMLIIADIFKEILEDVRHEQNRRT